MSIRIVLLSLVFVAFAAMSGTAQKPTVEMEQIIAVWKSRQEKIQTVRIEWSIDQVIHKGSNSFIRQQALKQAPQEPDPPRDYAVEGSGTLFLQRGDLRYRYTSKQWDPKEKRLYPFTIEESLVGDNCRLLNNPPSGTTPYALAHVGKPTLSNAASSALILPLIGHLAGLQPRFRRALDIEQYEVSNRTVTVQNRPCIELVHRNDKTANLLYLDKERDYVLVQKMTLVGNKPAWVFNVTYARDEHINWMVQSWEYVVRPTGTEILSSARFNITRYELNPPATKEEFTLRFPPGTRVLDESSGTEVQYIVAEDEKPRGEVPSSANPTYEVLKEQPIRSMQSAGYWYTAVGLIFLGSLAGLIWLRSRRAQP